MECKAALAESSGSAAADLIDTLWNVKVYVAFFHKESLPDLIDTLWNVKETVRTAAAAALADLIDTLWNVKADGPSDPERRLRI